MKTSSPVAHKQVYGQQQPSVGASVIIVAYKTGDELFACLDSLQAQTYTNFETIVVDNDACDTSRLQTYPLTYLQLDTNYGPSYARNCGAAVARGKLFLFLDDDAIASPDWVAAAVQALAADKTLCAVRGRITPKHPTYANQLAYHYDLGDSPHPAYLDLEGNCAVRAHAYHAAQGFDAALFGGEGLDLSYRLESAGHGVIGYEPAMLIKHDFVDSWRHFLAKSYRHGKNEYTLGQHDAAIQAYKQRYVPYYVPSTAPPLPRRIILFGIYLVGQIASRIGVYIARTRTSSRKAPAA